MQINRPHNHNVSRMRATAIFLVWLSLIFATSCTVIRPQEFFDLVQRFAGFNQDSIFRFRIFWGIAWFAIVKGWHFTEFLILTILCARVLQWWFGAISRNTISIAMLFCFVFAASDEWHQTYVPERSGTIQDVFIDGLGVSAAGAFLLARHRSSKVRSHS